MVSCTLSLMCEVVGVFKWKLGGFSLVWTLSYLCVHLTPPLPGNL